MEGDEWKQFGQVLGEKKFRSFEKKNMFNCSDHTNVIIIKRSQTPLKHRIPLVSDASKLPISSMLPNLSLCYQYITLSIVLIIPMSLHYFHVGFSQPRNNNFQIGRAHV